MQEDSREASVRQGRNDFLSSARQISSEHLEARGERTREGEATSPRFRVEARPEVRLPSTGADTGTRH